MRLKLILITLIVLVSQQLFAQSEANISQYYAVPTLFNPAATGQTDFVRIRGGARLQWVGIDNAPRTFIGAADMPFKLGNSRVGVGAVINQESIGLFSGLDLGVQASYKLRKWGGVWSIGLQIGFRDQSFKAIGSISARRRRISPGHRRRHTDKRHSRHSIRRRSRPMVRSLQILRGTLVYAPHVANYNNECRKRLGGSETNSARRYEFKTRRTLYFTAGCNIPIKIRYLK